MADGRTFRPTSLSAGVRSTLLDHQPGRTRDGRPVARAIVRDDLRRSLPFTVNRAEASDHGDGLTMQGTAAVFNDPTLIDSFEGRFWEQLAPGSFRKTLSERTPKLQFDHGSPSAHRVHPDRPDHRRPRRPGRCSSHGTPVRQLVGRAGSGGHL
jgi:hypothetical protein